MGPNNSASAFTFHFEGDVYNKYAQAKGIVIDSIVVKNQKWVGPKFSYVDWLTISNCDIDSSFAFVHGRYDSTTDAAVGVDLIGCHHYTITQNHFGHAYNAFPSSIGHNSVAVTQKGGCTYGTITRNFIEYFNYMTAIGEDAGPDYWRPQVGSLDEDGEITNYEAKKVVVSSNIISHVAQPFNFGNAHHLYFVNNTFHNPIPWDQDTNVPCLTYCMGWLARGSSFHDVFEGVQCDSLREIYFLNNVFDFAMPQYEYGHMNDPNRYFDQNCGREKLYDYSTWHFENNLFCRRDLIGSPDFESASLPDFASLHDCDSIPHQSAVYSGNFVGIPVFKVSEPSDAMDFLAGGTSPTENAGVYIPYVPIDYLGRRFQDVETGGERARSVGAYEVCMDSAYTYASIAIDATGGLLKATWTTDKPTNGQVEWRKNDLQYWNTDTQPTYSLSHSITLTGATLSAGDMLHYRIKGETPCGMNSLGWTTQYNYCTACFASRPELDARIRRQWELCARGVEHEYHHDERGKLRYGLRG